MTLSTRSRIFCGHLDLKTAPRFSVCDPLASSAAGAAFFRPLLGGGGAAIWLEPASGTTGRTWVVGWLGAGSCFARDTRAFFAAEGLGVLAGSSEVAATLEERRGLVRVLFEASGGIMDGSACIDIWDWSGKGFATTDSSRFLLLRTISERKCENASHVQEKVRQKRDKQ